MARFDLPLDQLVDYRPPVAEPADFDEFWGRTLEEARAAGPGEARVREVDAGLPLVRVQDVTFPGFAGDPVRAWLIVPRGVPEPLPAVVEFLGYGGGRGLPHDHLAWAVAGFATLVVDTRGQGSTWGAGGATPDGHGTGPAYPGSMTRGIEDPEGYYYRRLVTDAVRAVDHVRSRPEVDPARVAVVGTSQGGGMALAAGALHPEVAAVVTNVPFLCHLERALTLTDAGPCQEVVSYLRVHRGSEEAVRRTLSYVDGVNMARRVTAPTMVSVALMDLVCPPSTVYAAVNHLPSPARVEVYPWNGHEGGGSEQWRRSARWLREVLGEG